MEKDKMDYTKEEIDTIARVCHAAVRGYNAAIGDPVQPDWDDGPEWMRASVINGVFFHLETIKTPQESHEHWMAYRAAEGWKYGEVKDDEKRLHPCMRPFDELPKEQRIKDHLFIAIIRAMTTEFRASEG